ncbi:MAG: hypothetical protein M0P18_06770 [Syntrophales bacterium]|jgi:hypothetical protein|nr:hypothetical protein [Syntrophales bacterium]
MILIRGKTGMNTPSGRIPSEAQLRIIVEKLSGGGFRRTLFAPKRPVMISGNSEKFLRYSDRLISFLRGR